MSDFDDTAKPKPDRRRHRARRKFPSVRVDVAGLSHVGRVRTNNEDHFLIARFGRFFKIVQTNLPDAEAPPSVEEGGTAMVVADGIGGHAAGERASLLAILTLHQLAMETPDWLFRLNDDRVQTVMRRTRERGAAVDAALAEMAKSDPELQGFGTTMTLLSTATPATSSSRRLVTQGHIS